tara:strand:- start:2195 stop:2785 length:591 start_codon:yes stop_codon:yes gene_type:complete
LPKRNANSPWGSAYKEGLPTTAVNDTIDINQELFPSVDTGFIDVKTGKWNGLVASDEQFNIMQLDNGVANGAEILTPSTNPDGTWPLDMTGYDDLFFAIKTTESGNYKFEAVQGPSGTPFANLSPVSAGALLKGNNPNSTGNIDVLLEDAAESIVANVWTIFYFAQIVKSQKLLRFKITNNSGGSADIETAFLRVV